MITIHLKTTDNIFKKKEYITNFELPQNIEQEQRILSFISGITLKELKEVIITNDEKNNEYYEI